MFSANTGRPVLAAKLAIILAVTLFPANQLPAAQPGSTKQHPDLAKTYDKYGVSAAVRAGDFVYLGGITALDNDGNALGPYDGDKQYEVVYERIAELLDMYGADAKNVISETIYITGWNHAIAGSKHRDAFYKNDKAAWPNATGIEVVSLAVPGLVVEVEVVAYLGD